MRESLSRRGPQRAHGSALDSGRGRDPRLSAHGGAARARQPADAAGARPNPDDFYPVSLAECPPFADCSGSRGRRSLCGLGIQLLPGAPGCRAVTASGEGARPLHRGETHRVPGHGAQSSLELGHPCAMQARLETDQPRLLVADRQLECGPTWEGPRAEGGCKAPPRADGVVSEAEQPEQYRAGATPHEPGYHRVYGETTKRAPEASVFRAATPQ